MKSGEPAAALIPYALLEKWREHRAEFFSVSDRIRARNRGLEMNEEELADFLDEAVHEMRRLNHPEERSMPTIQSAAYVIAVNDLARSSQFYQDVLGFKVREIGDDGWRFFERDNCLIRAGHCPDAISPRRLGDHAYFAYIIMDGIEEYFEQVQARGGRILKKLRDEPWGMREFALETVDGHRIMFASVIQS